MDLVGPIHPPSSRGNKYVLTVIDMLTGFHYGSAYQEQECGKQSVMPTEINIYCTFRGSSRILTDNGSEFKNQEMQTSVRNTRSEAYFFPGVHAPESNGCLEGWHRFFKACIAKHI